MKSSILIEMRMGKFVFSIRCNAPVGAKNGLWVGWIKSERTWETIAVGITPYGWHEWSWDFEDKDDTL